MQPFGGWCEVILQGSGWSPWHARTLLSYAFSFMFGEIFFCPINACAGWIPCWRSSINTAVPSWKSPPLQPNFISFPPRPISYWDMVGSLRSSPSSSCSFPGGSRAASHTPRKIYGCLPRHNPTEHRPSPLDFSLPCVSSAGIIHQVHVLL